jgi:lipopolysaccharide export system permease protein
MLRLLDKLVLREIFGPWLFGVAMFSVVLMAGTYLFRLTDYLVKGVDPVDVIKLSAYYLPGLIAKTLPMAVLLASLLSFARLSNDTEIVAVQAGGASLFRIMRPVMFFGLAVSLLDFAFGEYVVPGASLNATKLTAQVIKDLKQQGTQPYSQPLLVNGKVAGHLIARDINYNTGTMQDVAVVWWGKSDEPESWFVFKELYYVPGKSWLVRDGYVIISRGDTLYRSWWKDARPPFGQSLDFTPQTVLSSTINDYDALSLSQMRARIERLEMNPQDEDTKRKLRDLEVGYWTKFTIPLTALVFALVGAPTSIRRARQSVGVGVGISIAIIFAYYLFHSYLTVLAKGGLLHPAISAFLPVVVGLAAAVVLLVRKNH